MPHIFFPNQGIYTKDCEPQDDDRAGEERDALDGASDAAADGDG